MIIPSIDIMSGQAVQLIGGKEKALEAGCPKEIANKFSIAGEIAVIDLDAAMSQGNNRKVIQELCKQASCRVGGGIRDLQTAIDWLDAGASKVILGTKAVPEILSQLPKERVIAALDAVEGEVVVEGWKTKTGQAIEERMRELRGYVGGFLVTFVEREGLMQGTNLDKVKELVECAGSAKLTIAGGVTTAEDVATLDSLGADAQVGMALYTGKMDLADGITANLSSDREDGLWPTVVCDEQGVALGLAWSNQESVREAVNRQQGVYHSRKRGLWIKGQTSGATQELKRIDVDCDRDCLRFIVKQNSNGFCHLETYTCWGDASGLKKLEKILLARKEQAPEGSYTKRLLEDSELLKAKLLEEANELATASSKEEVSWEAADLLYFTFVSMLKAGVSFADVGKELEGRMSKVTRRKGDAKANN